MISFFWQGISLLAREAWRIACLRVDRPQPGSLMIRCALVAGLLAPSILAAQEAVTLLESASRALAAVAERQRVFLASAPGATSARNLATTLRLMAQFRSSSSSYGTWTPLTQNPARQKAEIPAGYFDRCATELMDRATRHIHLGHFSEADGVFSALCYHVMRLTMRVDPPPDAIARHRDLVLRLEASLRAFLVIHADFIGIDPDKLDRWKSEDIKEWFIHDYIMITGNFNAADVHYTSASRLVAMAAWSPQEWKQYVSAIAPHFIEKHSSLYHAAIEEGALREDIAGFSGTPWYPMGIGEFMDTLRKFRLPQTWKMLEKKGEIDPLSR